MNDHDLLVRIDERTASVLERLKAGDEHFKEHSHRIRALELWRSGTAGAMALLGALVAAAFNWRH